MIALHLSFFPKKVGNKKGRKSKSLSWHKITRENNKFLLDLITKMSRYLASEQIFIDWFQRTSVDLSTYFNENKNWWCIKPIDVHERITISPHCVCACAHPSGYESKCAAFCLTKSYADSTIYCVYCAQKLQEVSAETKMIIYKQ